MCLAAMILLYAVQVLVALPLPAGLDDRFESATIELSEKPSGTDLY